MRKADIKLEEGMDMTDFLANGKMVKDEKKVEVNIINGLDIWNTKYKTIEWAIQDMIPMRKKTVAVGDFEAGKSYLYLGAALSLASGKSDYLGFEIPRQRKVLYVDLENGQDETLKRIQDLTVGHNIDKENCKDTLRLVTKPGDFSDVFTMIVGQTEAFKPDVIIIDNLYQLSGASNIADADKIKPLLAKVENLRSNSEAAIVLIHHFNKNTQEQGITEERMAGSSTINWWYEYCVMLCKTNQPFSMYAVGKSRMGAKNPGIYGIEINDKVGGGVAVERGGLISSEHVKGLVIPERRKIKWETNLDRMADNFTANEWLNVCGDQDGESVTDMTAYRWLKEIISIGMVKKLSYGKYVKTELEFYKNDSWE